MSEKFSVEDILNEVKAMTGDKYVSDKQVTKTPDLKGEKTDDDVQMNFFSEAPSEAKDENVVGFSDMTPEEFFKKIDEESAAKAQIVNDLNEESEESQIINGFTVINEGPSEKVKEEIDNPYSDELEKTLIFDKNELKAAVEQTDSVEDDEQIKKDARAAEFEEILSRTLKTRHEHKPEHLLSAEEIKSGSIGDTPSLRFDSFVKDLTKKSEDEPQNNNDSVQEASVVEEIPDSYTESNENEEDLIKFFDMQYAKEEKQKQEPDVLTNSAPVEEEADKADDIGVIEEFTFEKHIDESDLDKPVINTSDNRFSKKTTRRIEEVGFDYSEEVENDDDVIDDYTNIDDEEPVKQDLDISLAKVSKRLIFTVFTFIFGFCLTVLPTIGVDLISIISPDKNLFGFLIANAVVLGVALIINISSLLRGLLSLITFKPDADSPLSVASLFVIAQCAISFVPQFSKVSGALPFFTVALIFAYILTLMGKKSMVVRIRSNFRLVATESVKQSCFAADDRMCDMLESDNFIGAPYVAASKSVINLHNYLRNSYCVDPSDNLSKLFAPIGLLAAVATLVFTYFVTKDISCAVAYATAVALVSVPASAILSVNSPIKKASALFRPKDGLISGYDAINEFADIDCVVLESEDLFPAGSVKMLSLRAFGDVSIEDVILKSAALTIGAGGPLADVFDKIIDGRKKMLPPVSDIYYEDGLGLTGNVEGKIVRVGNRKFIDSYGIYGLSDDSLEEKARQDGYFVIYTAIDDEVCGMFALKYMSIDPDIEDALYDLVSNGISIAVKTNDPNITAELIERVFEIPSEYVTVMEAHTAEYYESITKPCKNGDSMLSYGTNSCVFASLIVACKKLKTKISIAVVIQAILTILGFGLVMVLSVMNKGFENLNALTIIVYQLAVAIISCVIPSIIKRIK